MASKEPPKKRRKRDDTTPSRQQKEKKPIFEHGLCTKETIPYNEVVQTFGAGTVEYQAHQANIKQVLDAKKWTITIPLVRFRPQELNQFLQKRLEKSKGKCFVTGEVRGHEELSPRLNICGNGKVTLRSGIIHLNPHQLPANAARWTSIDVGKTQFAFSSSVFCRKPVKAAVFPVPEQYKGLKIQNVGLPNQFGAGGEVWKCHHVEYPEKCNMTKWIQIVYDVLGTGDNAFYPDLILKNDPRKRIICESETFSIVSTKCSHCEREVKCWEIEIQGDIVCGHCALESQDLLRDAVDSRAVYCCRNVEHSSLRQRLHAQEISNFYHLPSKPTGSDGHEVVLYSEFQEQKESKETEDSPSPIFEEDGQSDVDMDSDYQISLDLQIGNQSEPQPPADIAIGGDSQHSVRKYQRSHFVNTTYDENVTDIFRRAEKKKVFYTTNKLHQDTDGHHCYICVEKMLNGREAGVYCKTCSLGVHEWHTVGQVMVDERECIVCHVKESKAPEDINWDKETDSDSVYCVPKNENIVIFRHQRRAREQSEYYYFTQEDLSKWAWKKFREFVTKPVPNSWRYRISTKSRIESYGNNQRVKVYSGWRQGIVDDDHEVGIDMYCGLIPQSALEEISEIFDGAFAGANADPDPGRRAMNHKTGKNKTARDNQRHGVEPHNKYKDARKSMLSLRDYRVHRIVEHIKPLIEGIRGDKYPINCVQLVGYNKASYKNPHFDGKQMTNGEEIWGLTLDSGKVMSIGAKLHFGTVLNEYSVIKHKAGTLYRMRGKCVKKYWHSIARIKVKRNRTIMLRVADVNLK